MQGDERYSVAELADLGGVTTRTVRYYLAQGLLPATGQSGPGNKYDTGHLARLRLIRRLQGEHLPLAEIRRRLGTLRDDEIRALAQHASPPPPTGSAIDYLRSVLGGAAGRSEARGKADPILPPATPAPTETTSQPVERSQWERIALAPDIELHIRRPLPRAQNKQVDRLVTIARELLERDRS